MAAKLGKHHVARQMLEEILVDAPVKTVMLRVLVRLASTWKALGAPQFALVIISGADALVEANDARGRGWVLQLRASIQIDLESFDDARANLVAAARAYGKAQRPYDRALALVAIARLSVARGDAAGALRDARRAAAFARRKNFPRVHQLASLQEARALLLAGDAGSALGVLSHVLAQTIESPDNVIRFYAHFYLSKAYADAGDPFRSRVEFEQARYFVQFLDQASEEASEVKARG